VVLCEGLQGGRRVIEYNIEIQCVVASLLQSVCMRQHNQVPCKLLSNRGAEW
jgi:hypothetical protein